MSDLATLASSRRGFLFGAGALLIAKPKLLLSQLPVLHGDGEHDDTESLRALFRGEPVRLPGGDTFRSIEDDGWVGLRGGRYLLSGETPLLIDTYVTGATFIAAPGAPRAFLASGGAWRGGRTIITHCTFDCSALAPRNYTYGDGAFMPTRRVVSGRPLPPVYSRAPYDARMAEKMTREGEA